MTGVSTSSRSRILYILVLFQAWLSNMPAVTPCQPDQVNEISPSSAQMPLPVYQVFDLNRIPYETLNGNINLEIIENNQFQNVRPYNDGYTVQAQAGRDQSAAALCDNTHGDRSLGLAWSIPLNQTQANIIQMQGWSKAENVNGSPDGNYSLYIDITYQDGSTSWGHSVPFDTGTHDWQHKILHILPEKPIRHLSAYALFRNKQGKVWFDDIQIQQATVQPNMVPLDGLFVVPENISSSTKTSNTYQTEQMNIAMDPSNGAIHSITIKPSPEASTSAVTLPLSGAGNGFLLRDVKANSAYHNFIEGNCDPLASSLDIEIKEYDHAIIIEGRLQDTSNAPRAVNLLYAIPIDVIAQHWGDHTAQSRTITKPDEYQSWVEIGTGSNGHLSRYPFACVYSNEYGLALGIDMGKPNQWRLGYSAAAEVLYLSMDFGLHPITQNFPAAAEFQIVLYPFDPTWGFRAALDRYYHIFPEYFEVRSPDQGIWMPFTDVSTVEGWQDFGFKYHEGINNIPFDDSANILSFRYSEPSTWWMNMPPETPRTYENAMAQVQQYVDSAPRDSLHRNALAVMSSGFHDQNQRFQMQFRNEPWANGAVLSLNPNPNLPGEITEASLIWNNELAERLYGNQANGVLDGEYLDSLEAYVTADLNFREDHFEYSTTPLTFTLDTRQPVIHKAFSQYEFTRYLSDEMHARDKLLFANSVPYRFSFLCPWLDVMGTESNWVRDAQFTPDPDDRMNFRRAMVGQKPYLFLMNTNFDHMSNQIVEQYFQYCLFYGMFPSMFSHNAAEDPYWKNPTLYNRDRELFKRYIPMIKQIAEAGWQPITFSTTSQNIRLERFGDPQNNTVYLTAMNQTNISQTFTIAGTGPLKQSGEWTEWLNGESGKWQAGLKHSIKPKAVQVYQITFE